MVHTKGDAATKMEPADAVVEARTRARHRLIGAAVLLVVAVVSFPVIFETEPRPVPIDIPIEIPRRDNAPPLVAPSVPVTAPTASSMPSTAQAAVATTAPKADASKAAPAEPLSSSAPSLPSESSTVVGTAPQASPLSPSPVPQASPLSPSPAPAPVPTPRATNDGERARAILEARAPEARALEATTPTSTSPSALARYVVQVGAFADNEAAVATRKRVEQLGLKTYTQVAETPQGHRIRVRVGPFASRSDAEAALAKAKSAGMPAVLLTL